MEMKGALLAAAICFAHPAQAEPWKIGVVSHKWAASRLPHLPRNIIRGELTFDESYLNGIIISRQFGVVDFQPGIMENLFDGIRLEMELTASQHRGIQEHSEVTAAVTSRTPDLETDLGDFSFGWSNGFSYASSRPDLERGRDGVRGEDTVQFQYYMGFEVEYSPAFLENGAMFVRLHHRSGIYGLVSPPKTGSNFIGAGIRFDY